MTFDQQVAAELTRLADLQGTVWNTPEERKAVERAIAALTARVTGAIEAGITAAYRLGRAKSTGAAASEVGTRETALAALRGEQ